MNSNIENMLLEGLETKILHFEKFSKVVAERTKNIKELKEPNQETLNKKVDVLMYNTEVSYLFSELLILTSLVLQLNLKTSEIINTFKETYKDSIYKRKFSIEGEDIVETEKGFLEKARLEYGNSQFMRVLESQLNN